MENKDRKILNDNDDLNNKYNAEENFSSENNSTNYSFTKSNKSDTKNKLIIAASIVLVALFLFFVLNKFVFSKTSDGFPKGQLLEQEFSPNNADIMRVYGDTNNPVTSTFIRIEVESVQKKTTVYYQESINPANVDYEWSNDSNSIIINGVIYDKTKTFKEDTIDESLSESQMETMLESETETETETFDTVDEEV